MNSNMFYVVALGVGFKCPRKIHLNTQCPPPLKKMMTSYMNDPFSAAEGVRKVCPLPLPP